MIKFQSKLIFFNIVRFMKKSFIFLSLLAFVVSSGTSCSDGKDSDWADSEGENVSSVLNVCSELSGDYSARLELAKRLLCIEVARNRFLAAAYVPCFKKKKKRRAKRPCVASAAKAHKLCFSDDADDEQGAL